jgi:hypothetical protein
MIPDNIIEILAGNRQTVDLSLEEGEPGFVVVVLADVAHVVDGGYAQEGEGF